MSDHLHDINSLLDEVRNGSETAPNEFVSRYGAHILRIVRHRLHKSLRPKFDSQDFVQSVWKSFFAGLPERPEFDGPGQLLAYLTAMAQNKVADAVRKRMVYEKFSVNREQNLDVDELPDIDARIGRQPTPEEIAMARDDWQHLLARQPAEHRRILELLRSGLARKEVAAQLGVSGRTVLRVIHQFAPRNADESL